MKTAYLTALLWVAMNAGALAQDAPVPAPALADTPVSASHIKSPSILNLGPDASQMPGYAQQNNGQRAVVQPGNNSPAWRQVNSGAAGYSSLPVSQAPEAGVLIQPFVQYPGSRVTNAGEAWRQTRNHWLIPYGGALILISVLSLAIMFFTKGPFGHDYPASSRKIERFTPFERAAHWVNAAAFIALAVSGLTMAFGKFFILSDPCLPCRWQLWC
jgi:formate dehydrogenase subunit gamma